MSDNPYKDGRQKPTSHPVDEIIRDAMRRGEFDALPGAGKPLQLEDETFVPPEMRLANRLLKQNDLTPDWIALGKSIDERLQAARAALHAAHRRRESSAEAVWQAAQTAFRDEVTQINKLLLAYNLKLPPGFARRALINAEREISRL